MLRRRRRVASSSLFASAFMVLPLLTLLGGVALAGDDREPPVEMKVRSAFDLAGVPPGWIPVRITATHFRVDPEAPAGQGDRYRFALTTRARWGNGQKIVAYRDETIPVGATKRFWLYGYLDTDNVEMVVSAELAAGGARAAKPIELRADVQEPGSYGYGSNQTEPFRIGVVSGRNSAALSILRSLTLPNKIGAEPVPLEPQDLPDRRIGYAPFDLVVLNDVDLALLTPDQAEALRAWTLGGGRLLVSPGLDPTWIAQPFFRDLLPPGRPRAEQRTSFEGLTVPAYSAVAHEAGDTPKLGSAGAAERFAAGLGEVALLPIDVSGAPLRGLADEVRQRFWSRVFADYQPRAPLHTGRPWPLEVKPRVDATPHRLIVPEAETPILSIALLALVYVAVIGPVNFLTLRRFGREPLIVLTIPAIAVGFVALTFAAGYAWQGGRARTYETTLVHARAGQRFAVAERYFAIIPSRGLTVEHRFARGEEGLAVSTEQNDAAQRGFTIDQRERLVVQGLSVARGEAGMLRGESIEDLEGAIRVEIDPGGVAVINESRRELRSVVARAGSHSAYYSGGPLPPGSRIVLQGAGRRDQVAGNGFGGRATLDGRLMKHAVEWISTRQGAWALAAMLEPDPPTAGDDASADERAKVLLLEQ